MSWPGIDFPPGNACKGSCSRSHWGTGVVEQSGGVIGPVSEAQSLSFESRGMSVMLKEIDGELLTRAVPLVADREL